MHTILAFIALGLGTVYYGGCVLVAQLLRVPWSRNGVYQYAPRNWGKWLLRAAGVKLVVHGAEVLERDEPCVYLANHVSWYDIAVLIYRLPQKGFLAKRELEKIPWFGAAARGIGVVYVDRENRKSAFGAIEDAAEKVRNGRSVIVYPEGTRGSDYSLRPFKKGSFVLAIRAGVPVIPIVLYGTIHVNPRGTWIARPGTIHMHVLEPIPTVGMTYEQRNVLSNTVHARMEKLLLDEYGVQPLAQRNDVPEQTIEGDQVPA